MGMWIKVAAVVVVAVLAASVFVAWRDARKEQVALQGGIEDYTTSIGRGHRAAGLTRCGGAITWWLD